MHPLIKLELTGEPDLVGIRQTFRRLTRTLGFDHQDQIRITTAVSELTRGAGGAAGDCVTVESFVHNDPLPQLLVVQVTGPGLDPSGEDRRPDSNERLIAAQRLLGRFDRLPPPEGPTVRLCKPLPARTPFIGGDGSEHIRAELERRQATQARSYGDELSEQNFELSATLLLELEQKREEVSHLSAELGDTNRGVMALYAELDERAKHLRRADELKTRFFSYMSHEFRTPLNSILALSRLLLGGDGQLNAEQAKQVRLIRDSTADLLDLVSDLLDFSKVEAGKSTVSVVPFSVSTLFGALRGMIRPLLSSADVVLEFDTAVRLPQMLSDEAKIAQILRNFLSNAVKFTQQGSITVAAKTLQAGELSPAGDGPLPRESVWFSVADTGIGIRETDQEAIFHEWSQIKHTLQRRVRGTGLGLPLCRSLASLLGGQVWVRSELGRGSTFHLLVPRIHESAASETARIDSPASSVPILIVSDAPAHRTALEDLFMDGLFTAVSAAAADVTEDLIEAIRPAVAVVDPKATVAAEMIRRKGAAQLVILERPPPLRQPRDSEDVVSAGIVASVYCKLLQTELERVLVVDDDDAFRTILVKHLEPLCREVISTGNAGAALSAAKEGGIDCMILDLMMPRIDGFELLERLRASASTENLTILVCSSKVLSHDDRALLRRLRAPFLPKDGLEPARLARGLLEAVLSSRSEGAAARIPSSTLAGS